MLRAAVAATCALGASNAHANQRFWNGGGANNNWSTTGNWAPFFGAPANDGTDDIIMQGTTRLTPLLDIDYDILSLQFNATAGAFVFQAGGQDLSIRGGGITNNDADLQIISRVSLGTNQIWNAVSGPLRVNFVALGGLSSGRALTISGGFDTSIPNTIIGSAITNAGSIVLNSAANLTFGDGVSAQNNSFTGPITVNGGTLVLNKPSGTTAVPGNLVIGDGAGSDVVKHSHNNQIADTSNVTVNSSGMLNLNGQAETINNLTINGGNIATAGGSLTVNGNVTATGGTLAIGAGAMNATGSVSFNGSTVSLAGGTLTFGGASISSTIISGTFSALKGISLTAINSTLSATGSSKIDVAGVDLTAATISAVKANQNFAEIEVHSRAANTPSVINGVDSARALAPLLLDVEDGAAIDDLVTGPVGLDGAGGEGLGIVTKSGAGQLHLAGGGAGITDMFISDGTVLLDATNLAIADWAIAGTLRYARSSLLHDLSRMSVIEGGKFDLDGATDTIGFLDLRGGVATSGAAGSLTVGRVSSIASAATSLVSGQLGIGTAPGTGLIQMEDGPAGIDLDVPATISANLGPITVQGPGTLRLSNANNMGSSMIVQGGARVLAANDQAFGTAGVAINGSSLAADGTPRTFLNTITVVGSSEIFGDQPLTLNGSLGIAMNATLTKSGAATLSLTGPQLHGPGSTLNVNEGTVQVATDAGLNLAINVIGANGRIGFLARQHIAAINVNAGEAVIEPGGSRVVVASSLSVDTTDALIDVWEHAIIVDYSGGSPLAWIKSAIASAYSNGSWHGFGITSSLADATHRIGYAEASALGITTFAGENVDATAVLVKFTYAGDANLDGKVDVTDLGGLATNWQTSAHWTGGDFNYDGFVDVTDLGALATNWQAGVGSPLAPSQRDEALAAVGLASVPEPAIWLLAAGILLTPRRKRI